MVRVLASLVYMAAKAQIISREVGALGRRARSNNKPQTTRRAARQAGLGWIGGDDHDDDDGPQAMGPLDLLV